MPSIGMGISLALRSQILSEAAAFDPATLFAAGEEGSWYDPSDLTTMWTDTGATTQAGVGDAVARIDDKSGNGNHATQVTAAARPILRQTGGGLYYLEFDGVDDILEFTNGITGTSDHSIFVAGHSRTTADGGKQLISLGSDGFGGPHRSLTPEVGLRVGGGFETYADSADGANPSVITHTLSGDDVVDGECRVNGASSASTGSSARTLATTGDGALGGLVGNTFGGDDVNLYGVITRNKDSTASEISDTEAYLAEKAGVTL